MDVKELKSYTYQAYSAVMGAFFKTLAPLPLQSRVHLRRDGTWLKRDDELGSLAAVGKTRKWASLLPALQRACIEEVVLWGGAQSNHLVSAVSHLREAGITCKIFCRKTNHNQVDGNRLLLNLLAAEETIKWIERDDVEEAAHTYAHARRDAGLSVFVVPEGAAHAWALPGAATLGWDILRNEEECGVCWQHVWVDAGTGFSAQALIALWTLLGVQKTVHVVGMAGDEETFRRGIDAAVQQLRDLLRSIETEPQLALMQKSQMLAPHSANTCSWVWHEPPTARSFGAINQKVRAEVRRMACEEGVLLDPLYGAKLFLAYREQPTPGPTLLVHSGVGGGLLSLMSP